MLKRMFFENAALLVFLIQLNLYYDQGTKGSDLAIAAGKTLYGENNKFQG